MEEPKNDMVKKMSPEEIEKNLKILKSTWDMYEETKPDIKDKRENRVDKFGNRIYSDQSLKDTMLLVNTMQDDIKAKYLALGGNEKDLYAKKRGKKSGARTPEERKKWMDKILKKEIEIEAKMKEKEENSNNAPESEDNPQEYKYTTYDEIAQQERNNDVSEVHNGNEASTDKSFFANDESEPEEKNGFVIDASRAMGNKIKYDVIPLPSKGECYKSKMAKIPVAYLTAYDENMIIAPNLYRDGTFLDYMLKTKIMTNEIDADDLLPGDRDAIILWLRASGYGTDFPVNVTDNVTGAKFDTIVDLNKLNYRKFTLKGDANGYFDFELPITKDKVKFKFLTYKDTKDLDKMEIDDNLALKKNKVLDVCSMVTEYIDDDSITNDIKTKLKTAEKNIREYAESIDVKNDEVLFSRMVTNKLEKSIVSINGVTNRDYIHEYVEYMNVMDSTALRKYITNNEPGVDFNITVERPESLGGGSMAMFLTLDQYIFLNIA